MPLLVGTSELRPKMRLARSVTHGQRVLLPAGKVLNGADCRVLQANYPELMVYVADPMLDEMVVFTDDAHDREVARKAKGQLVHALTGVRKRFASHMSLAHVDFKAMQEAVAEVVEFIRNNPVAAAILAEHAESSHYLTEHPANVFYLGLVLGSAVGGYAQRARAHSLAHGPAKPSPPLDLTPLALAALFQDVSLWALEELYQTCAPLTPQQREFVRRHPLASAELLPAEMPRQTLLAIRMHHENHDGSGYPHGLAGDEIHLFARILRICDAFDAAVSLRVYAQAKSPARALGEMIYGAYARLYDPLLLKVFAHLVQPFPIGARVRLECGRCAVVVRHGHKDPFLPVVIIAFDRDGNRLGTRDIEGPFALDEHPELRIQFFAGEDLSDLYTGERHDTGPLVLTEFSTLFESSYP